MCKVKGKENLKDKICFSMFLAIRIEIDQL